MPRRLAITLLLSLPVFLVYGQKGDWDADYADSYAFEGTGTADSPYLIKSVTDLIFLADCVNAWQGESYAGRYFLLTTDIDLGEHHWIPIATEEETPFRGVFDGGGYSICNLYIGNPSDENNFPATGFFGYVGNGARIENLTIDGGLVVGSRIDKASFTGALAGHIGCTAEGTTDSVVIINCRNMKVDVSGTGGEASSTGGLIGEAYSHCFGQGTSYIRIDSCSNTGAVSDGEAGTSYTGGILGKAGSRSYADTTVLAWSAVSITAAENDGIVTGGNAKGDEGLSAAGGIVGYMYGEGDAYGSNSGSAYSEMFHCFNRGKVRGGTALTTQSLTYAGGLTGYADGAAYAESGGQGLGSLTITCSANRGDVIGGDALRTPAAATGGLVGYATASAASAAGSEANRKAEGRLVIRDCYSYASVTARRGVTGGLVGSMGTADKGSQAETRALMADSYAAGSINRGDTVYPVISGGIAGRAFRTANKASSLQISNCLVALTYLNGALQETFRIVGRTDDVIQRQLRNNYAYIADGEWVFDATEGNGLDWEFSFMDKPVSEWDFTGGTWIVRQDHTSMPLLGRLHGQTEIPIP